MKNNYKFILLFLFAALNLKTNAACTTPSSSAGTPVITCQSQTAMTITWTAAGTVNDCNGYVLIRRTTSAGTFSLTAGTVLPSVSGTAITFGNIMNCYIDYVGPNLSATSNVTAGVQYYYYVIPYNNAISACSPAPVYKTSSVATVTNLRPVVGLVSNFTNGTPTPTTIPNISFSPPSGGADGYLVCTNPNALHAYPTNGTVYNIGDTFNNSSGAAWDQTVQYVGPNTSGITASTNLTPNTTYSINVYAYRSKYTCSGPLVYVGTFAANTKDNVKTALGTGIADNFNNNADGSVLLYPNPAGKELRIKNEELKIEKIEIYNVLGEKMYTGQSDVVNRKSEIVVDLSSFSKGIYFLQVKSGTALVSKKFVKQ